MIGLIAAVAVLAIEVALQQRRIMRLTDAVIQLQQATLALLDPDDTTRT